MDERPLPRPTALTAPYWASCGRGELVIQRCTGCARYVHFPEHACPSCGGELRYRPVSGRGTVHTFSVVHRTFLPGFAPPYVIAWIDLAEGVRVFGNVVPPEDVRIGTPVHAHFPDIPGFGRIPTWRTSRD